MHTRSWVTLNISINSQQISLKKTCRSSWIIQTTRFRLKPFGKSGSLTQTTHVRLKPYAWVSFKPFTRTQTIREIWWCYSNHSLQFKPYAWVSFKPFAGTQTIRETRWCYSNHSFRIKPYAWVSFKPFTRTQTIPQIPPVLFKPYLFVSTTGQFDSNHSHQNFVS